ncbi:hypothetical protein PENTCL1PPCAC_28064, partial [Pristionchus entomophagus]
CSRGMNRNDEELAQGPIFKRRTIADWHLFIEVIWMVVYSLAQTHDDRQMELMIAGVFCLGVFASRLMIFAVDFFRVLAIPAFVLTLAQLVPRLYIVGITIIYETVDLTAVNPYNISLIALSVVIVGHIWVCYEYGRAYYLIAWEKGEANMDEECRVESDEIWKQKQKIRKRLLRKKQRDERKAEVERKLRENGTVIDEDTPSSSIQPSTSHDHFYVERD